MSNGALYEREVQSDGTVTVPDEHAALEACVIEPPGIVIDYVQVQSDGTIDVGVGYAGTDVKVVIPDDDSFEEYL